MKKILVTLVVVIGLCSQSFASSTLIWTVGTHNNDTTVIEQWSDTRTPEQYQSKFVEGDTKEEALAKVKANIDDYPSLALYNYIQQNQAFLAQQVAIVRAQGYPQFYIQTPLGVIHSSQVN